MTMAIFRENGIESIDLLQSHVTESESSTPSSVLPLVRSKLEVPKAECSFEREWLLGLLERYTAIGAATMLIGRTGTGKSCLAAGFARRYRKAAWYSVESADSDWQSFQRYFRTAWTRDGSSDGSGGYFSTPLEFFSELPADDAPSLMVLDNLHHLYDCQWFPEFFAILMGFVPQGSHLLLLSRIKPPAPVWRFRSKQVLNVIDEKLLAFSVDEAKALFKTRGLGPDEAFAAHKQSFGRAAELVACFDKMSARRA